MSLFDLNCGPNNLFVILSIRVVLDDCLMYLNISLTAL